MQSEEDFTLQTELEIKDNQNPKKYRRLFLWFLALFGLILISVYSLFSFIQKPPIDFPVDTALTIPAGATVQDVAFLLKENNFIRSEFAFFLYFSIFENPASLKASTYLFSKPQTVPELSRQLVEGNYGEGLLRLTHIEGESVEDLAKRAKLILLEFSETEFIALAKVHEGKLFPETYMIPDTYNEQELLDLLLKTFTEKTTSLQTSASTSLSFDEVIILASILEREANTKESKEIVSGILQNRLAIDMPLQADATIEYALHKPLSELTAEDLKIDSPYNSYLNKGLPPTPIGNPGLEAIEAVLYPTKTEYMFYITDENGDFYYAKDFDEHRRNIAKYLR